MFICPIRQKITHFELNALFENQFEDIILGF